jgi:hypothetical protein
MTTTRIGESNAIGPLHDLDPEDHAELGESEALLPIPPHLQDPLTVLEALLLRMNGEQHNKSRELHDAAIHRVEAEGRAQVQALHDTANDVLKEGIISGIGQAAGGLASGYGGIAGLGDSGDAKLQAWAGAGSFLEGSGKAWASWYGAARLDHQGRATEASTQQDVAQEEASQARSDSEAARDASRTLLQAFQRILELEQASMMAAIGSLH